MQKKVLVSSILVIALCLSVIAGSTFALFTDKAENTIAITSGDVEVDAKLSIADVWSAEYTDGTFKDSYLVDEHGTNYAHKPQTKEVDGKKYFANGGYAELVNDGTKIEITNITPGDRVDATINVKNTGNVDMIYRYKIQANGTDLADVMVLTVDGKDYKGAELYVSAWSDVVHENESTAPHAISIELPVYVPSEDEDTGIVYERKDVSYTITVEAVQGNAEMPEYNAPSTANTADSVEELQDTIDALSESGESINALINLGSNIEGDIIVPQVAGVALTIDGNGATYGGAINIGTVSGSPETSSIIIKNINFVADSLNEDAFINLGDGTNNARYIKNVTVENCTFTDTDGMPTEASQIVAIKSYTGGDKKLVISNCVVNDGMHSLLQVKNVEEGLVITNCKVNSKNGVNVVSTPTMVMSNCVFNVKGYAFRTDVNGSYTFDNCTLKSACAEADDAVIVLRGNATEDALILNNTTLTGVRDILEQ